MQRSSNSIYCFKRLAVSACLLILPTFAFAEANIGDGQLFLCSQSTAISTNSGEQVSEKAARVKLKRTIQKQAKKLRNAKKGSKKWLQAKVAKETAKAALYDLKLCLNGALDTSSGLKGVWNLILEDGRTPSENGYHSIVLSLDQTQFMDTYESDSATCSWMGNVDLTESRLSLETTSATGAPCNSAVGKTATAEYELSPDGESLILDFSAESFGTLQVYERIS